MTIKQATNNNGSEFRLIGSPTCNVVLYEIERLHQYGEFKAWQSASSFYTFDKAKAEAEFSHIINSNF